MRWSINEFQERVNGWKKVWVYVLMAYANNSLWTSWLERFVTGVAKALPLEYRIDGMWIYRSAENEEWTLMILGIVERRYIVHFMRELTTRIANKVALVSI